MVATWQYALIAATTAFYWGLFFLSRHLVVWLSPHMGRKSARDKDLLSAMIRWPSQLNCVVSVFLGVYLITSDDALRADRVFGHSTLASALMCFACGYFVFDFMHTFYDFQGVAFLIHAVFCTSVYGAALKPFLQYYGACFLIFEASTFWMNAAWYARFALLWDANSTGVKTLKAIFAISFLLVRIVFGDYSSYLFYQDMYHRVLVPNGHITAFESLFVVANIVLSGLNHYWMYKIVEVFWLSKDGEKKIKHLKQ